MSAGVVLAVAGPANAFSPCAPRELADNIQNTVLAYKAAEFCKRDTLPYTITEVAERLESLRCNAQSSKLIDDLMSNYDQQYRDIMTRDARQVVCMKAAGLSFN